MSDSEKNRLSMYETVIMYLLENKDIISVNRSFSFTINKLRKAIDEIKIKDKELSSDTLEKTILTYNAKDELIFALVPVTAALYNFAKENGNIELKEKCRMSQSNLVRLRDNELLNKSIAMHHFALNYFSRLGKFGIRKNTLQDLNNKIEKFRNALDNKIVTFVSSNAVLSLNASFQEAERILNDQMDKLMEPFNDENEEFYDDYLSIRSMEYVEGYEDESLEIENEE
jgi:hypothetical protein